MKKLQLVICVMLWATIPGNADQCAVIRPTVLTDLGCEGPNPARGCLFIEDRGDRNIFLFAFRRREPVDVNRSHNSQRSRRFCDLANIAPPKSKKEDRNGRFYKQVTPNGVTTPTLCRVGNSEEASGPGFAWIRLDQISMNGGSPNTGPSQLGSRSSTNESPTVFHHIPKPSQKFSTWKKVNLVWWFGNADDPVPPLSYRKGKCCRKFMWYVRNPFHNFDHYVIGIGDKHFTRVGRFPDRQANPNGGWNWTVCRYRNLRLPFVDYQRGGFEFYCGWRNGGNFGMKLNFGQKRAAISKKVR